MLLILRETPPKLPQTRINLQAKDLGRRKRDIMYVGMALATDFNKVVLAA